VSGNAIASFADPPELAEPGSLGPPPAAGRTRRLLDGAISAMLSKGVVVLANLVSIPIAIRYLGAESFGVWMTISAGLSMLLMLDLGVANSLTNFISEAYARDDRDHASTYATTALAVMAAFALLLGGAACWAWPLLDWRKLFHLSPALDAPPGGSRITRISSRDCDNLSRTARRAAVSSVGITRRPRTGHGPRSPCPPAILAACQRTRGRGRPAVCSHTRT